MGWQLLTPRLSNLPGVSHTSRPIDAVGTRGWNNSNQALAAAVQALGEAINRASVEFRINNELNRYNSAVQSAGERGMGVLAVVKIASVQRLIGAPTLSFHSIFIAGSAVDPQTALQNYLNTPSIESLPTDPRARMIRLFYWGTR